MQNHIVSKKHIAFLFAIFLTFICISPISANIPQLVKKGNGTQLIVDGKPFIMLAGETHNSSSSVLNYMNQLWPRLKALNVNTVLTPVTWEQFEPEEGKFDYTLIDGLIEQARENEMKLVILWFGSWKNGLSTYIPSWVKLNTERFPRSHGANGKTKDILTPLSSESRDADARAFAALMKRIKEIDGTQHTVIMMQVENEVGIQPEPRDMSPEATAAFNSEVPQELIKYLTKNRKQLHPEILRRWGKNGYKTTGTWPEVFGGSWEADEIFSAWTYAKYVQAVTAAGKKEYPLPMYVNAWLPDPNGQPHTWPSGGPVPNVLDIWRAAAPDIDCLAPDIYQPGFKWLCDEYTRNGNALMIPEAHRGEDAAARAYWAIGHGALCFAPFGIESLSEDHSIKDAYSLLEQAMPLITDAQGTDRMTALYWQDSKQEPKSDTISLGNWNIFYRYTEKGLPEGTRPGGIIIQSPDNTDEFYVIGQGIELGFRTKDKTGPQNCDILVSEMGHFEDGVFVTDLRLNGDEIASHSTNLYRTKIPINMNNAYLDPSKPRILRVSLYRYE